MKFAALAFSAFLIVAPCAAFAQAPAAPATTSAQEPGMLPQVGVSPVPIVVSQPAATSGGGAIQLAVFGWLEPYIDSAVQGVIASLVGWVLWVLKNKFNVDVDKKHSDEITKFLQNRASSLIADGAVRMQGVTVKVDSARLAEAVNSAGQSIPDAVAHFGLTPDVIAAKIVDAIPQVPAGAEIVSAAHENAPPMTAEQVAAAAPTPEPEPVGKPA